MNNNRILEKIRIKEIAYVVSIKSEYFDIIEISTKHIKYKDCDNQEGPLISILKKDVVMIKYITTSIIRFIFIYIITP